jgi:uncharacterized membrane protein
MSEYYLWVKWVHVLSSTVLFGMGAGIALFFLRAQRTGDSRVIAAVARDVVFADALFTTTAVITQPLSGIVLARLAGFPLTLPWLELSIALYLAVGCCWIPVVFLQMRMRRLAEEAAASGSALGGEYLRCYRWWFGLGWPAFSGVLVIFYLMVRKPGLW